MSVLSGYGKYKRYVLTSTGYKLCSQWTSSNTVHFDDGKTAQTKLGAISGITDSLTATSSNVALSAKAGKSLQDQVTELNTGITGIIGVTSNLNTSNKSNLVGAINQLVAAINTTHATANSNGLLSDALLVDLTGIGNANFSYIVDATITKNMPPDCAWGIRIVYCYNQNSILVQIIGVSKDGTAASVWVNCYNVNHWTGWRNF